MEIKEPVAIFNAEGFKMLIEALQGKKVDLAAFTGERAGEPMDPPESEVDSFIDGYEKYKGEEVEITPYGSEEQYKAAYSIIYNAGEPVHMSYIRDRLKHDYGIVKGPKSYTSFLNSVMKRYPIQKFERGMYGLKPEFMDEDIFEGDENE